jgi:hypothetical protein
VYFNAAVTLVLDIKLACQIVDSHQFSIAGRPQVVVRGRKSDIAQNSKYQLTFSSIVIKLREN